MFVRPLRALALVMTTLAAALAPLGGSAHARPATAPPNVVLLDLGLHVIGAGYQRTLSDRLALSVTTGLYDPWTETDEVGDVRGAYLRLRPYFFVVGSAPRGLWLSPFVQGALVRVKDASGSTSGLAGAVGLAAGYAFLFRDWLHLGLGAGGQYHAVDTSSDDPGAAFHGFHWHVDATIGVAF